MPQGIIGPISPNLQVPEIQKKPRSGAVSEGPGFGEILKDAISTANELQQRSNLEIEKLMTGESQDLHATMIAVQKADLSFQTMMQVRNKLIQAYQEIMRIQV